MNGPAKRMLNKIRAELFPVYEKERRESPGAFRLSLKEAKTVMKAHELVTFPALYGTRNIEEVTQAVQEQILEEMRERIQQNHIDVEGTLRLCDKVITEPYWTFYLTNLEAGNGTAKETFSVRSNVDGLTHRDWVTPERFPDFYQGQNGWSRPPMSECAKILSIPEGVLFVPELELQAVTTIKKYFSVFSSEPDATGEEPTKEKELKRQIMPSIVPAAHIMPNCLLMNELAGLNGTQPINGGGFDLAVMPVNAKQPEISAFVMITYEPESGVTSSLTEYARDVSDSIMSIWEQAQKDGKLCVFTEPTIFKSMPGGGDKPSPQQKGAITRTVHKLIHLYVELDATDELRRRGKIGENDKYQVKDFYLSAQEHIYTAQNGKPVRAWLMDREPIMLSYAKMIGQVVSVPSKFLNIVKVKQGKLTTESLSMTTARQAMVSYMLRRIAVMKHDKQEAQGRLRAYNKRRTKGQMLDEKPLEAFRRQSDVIRFDSLFRATGNENKNREVNRRNREFCFDVLEFWKTSGFIEGYQQQTRGRAVTGIKIEH